MMRNMKNGVKLLAHSVCNYRIRTTEPIIRLGRVMTSMTTLLLWYNSYSYPGLYNPIVNLWSIETSSNSIFLSPK